MITNYSRILYLLNVIRSKINLLCKSASTQLQIVQLKIEFQHSQMGYNFVYITETSSYLGLLQKVPYKNNTTLMSSSKLQRNNGESTPEKLKKKKKKKSINSKPHNNSFDTLYYRGQFLKLVLEVDFLQRFSTSVAYRIR